MVGTVVYFLHRNAKLVLSLAAAGVIALSFSLVLIALYKLLGA